MDIITDCLSPQLLQLVCSLHQSIANAPVVYSLNKSLSKIHLNITWTPSGISPTCSSSTPASSTSTSSVPVLPDTGKSTNDGMLKKKKKNKSPAKKKRDFIRLTQWRKRKQCDSSVVPASASPLSQQTDSQLVSSTVPVPVVPAPPVPPVAPVVHAACSSPVRSPVRSCSPVPVDVSTPDVVHVPVSRPHLEMIHEPDSVSESDDSLVCSSPACFVADSDTRFGLRFCTRCRTVKYCSTKCQSNHWPEHKFLCKVNGVS